MMKYIDCQTFAYFCGLSKFMEMLKAHILVLQARLVCITSFCPILKALNYPPQAISASLVRSSKLKS